MKEVDVLPDKPSAIIRVAEGCLSHVEAQPDIYELEMAVWHVPIRLEGYQKCHVCFSGAVIAGAFEAAPDERVSPNDFSAEIATKLFALYVFAKGRTADAVQMFGASYPGDERVVSVPHLGVDRQGFHSKMLDIALSLERLGL